MNVTRKKNLDELDRVRSEAIVCGKYRDLLWKHKQAYDKKLKILIRRKFKLLQELGRIK